MPFINFSERKKIKIWEGISGSMYHSDQLSFVHIDFEAGAEANLHHHVHEQWTHIIEGEILFTLDGEERLLTPGMAVFIPSDVPHAARSITGCKLIDCFLPVRQDFVELEKNTP